MSSRYRFLVSSYSQDCDVFGDAVVYTPEY